MRISEVAIKYFKGIKEITTSLNNGVFYVCGHNESGKSSFLDGLTFALLGKKAFAQGMWKEITATTGDKTETSCVLVDKSGVEVAKITRKITKSGNESAKIEMLGDRKFTQKELNDIINPIALNPKAFMDMSPKEQALFLGIDTAELDRKYKSVYDDRTFIGKDVKRLQGAVDESRCEKPDADSVDLDGLYKKRSDAGTINNEALNARTNIVKYNNEIRELQSKIDNIRIAIDGLKPASLMETVDINIIVAAIETAKASQGLVQKYEYFQKYQADLKKAELDYKSKTDELDIIKVNKVRKIKEHKLPFENLATNDDGGLVVVKDGKEMPLNVNFFSTGKVWEMAIKILALKDTGLRTVIIKDASLLDEEKLGIIAETAREFDLQVLLEMVQEVSGDNSITLIEGELQGEL